MTELEIMQRAKMYMDKLSQGIDPITDREMPEDAVLNNVRLARCFFYVSDVLGKVIANDGYVGAKPKVKLEPFAIHPDQLAKIQVSQVPVRITQLVEMISAATENPGMKKLSITAVTNWLLKKGFLELQQTPDGKSRRVPSANGYALGLSVETRQGQYGEYQAVFYNAMAQQFVLDNLPAILEER